MPTKETNIAYVHPATGSRSSIDLAICDPALFLDISWNVNDDLCASDHFKRSGLLYRPTVINRDPTSDRQFPVDRSRIDGRLLGK